LKEGGGVGGLATPGTRGSINYEVNAGMVWLRGERAQERGMGGYGPTVRLQEDRGPSSEADGRAKAKSRVRWRRSWGKKPWRSSNADSQKGNTNGWGGRYGEEFKL